MAENLNVIIVEDNFSFTLELEIIVQQLGHKLLASADNSGDALVEILDKKPDLILMDIDIKGKLSGIDIAEKITHLKIPIIFITSFANDEYYDKAESIFNTTYIIKPVDLYTLKSAINLLMKTSTTISNQNSFLDYEFKKGVLYLKKKSDFFRIELDDIVLIESDRVYCKTILSDGSNYHNRISLQEYSAYLTRSNFIRPHRSFIINAAHIKKVNLSENIIIMDNELSVPISRTAKSEIKSYLNLIN